MRAWRRLPIFWKFQLVGWSAYVVLSFPFKLLFVGSADAALWISLLRDGMALLLTLGMRTIYKWAYERRMSAERVALLIAAASLAAGWLLALLSLEVQRIIVLADPSVMHAVAQTRVAYFCVSLCVAWSALYFGIRRMREASALELRVARIESERKEAELRLLRAQMQPHFLFNALNTIRTGIAAGRTAVVEQIDALAGYLRFSLAHRNDVTVPLADEFGAAVDYLTVEKARYGEELEIECELEAGVSDIPVPPVILQPLVENSVKHGRSTSPVPLQVRIGITADHKNVRIEVSNSGRWLEQADESGVGGLGLENLRRRLNLQYAGQERLEIKSADGWVAVGIILPKRT